METERRDLRSTRDIAGRSGPVQHGAGLQPTTGLFRAGMNRNDRVAGLVLGSNSFHLLAARHEGDRIVSENHWQEPVQLATGIGADGLIEPAHLERARACLDRFASELAGFRPSVAAAVATGVLRRAGNAGSFLQAAADTLGVPIHLLSGRDEAFLTYVGVVLTFQPTEDNRLVVDIGGGSTELVIGRRLTVVRRESVDLGCAAMTRRFFPEGAVSARAFSEAEEAAGDEFRQIADGLRGDEWEEVVGTGGTIMAAGTIMQVQRMCGSAVSRKGLDRLKSAMIEQRLEEIARDVASPERVAVLPGGVALLSALFDVLGIDRMRMSAGALREGVLVMLVRGELPGERVIRPD